MDRAFIIICALAINGVAGGYAARGLRNIIPIPARFVRDIERKLNREHRSAEDLQLRGLVLAGLCIFSSIIVGGICNWLFHHNLRFIELLMLAMALPVRPAWDLAVKIRRKLYTGDIAGAKMALSDTPWRHHALLDEYGVARAAIETLAVHFSEKIFAPVCWYLLLGLPGLFISKSIYMLQETLVRPNDPSPFGNGAKMAHAWLHGIPVRLAALLWMLVSVFMPSAKWQQVVPPIVNTMGKESPHVIALQSAASVLKIALGGPTSIYSTAWISTGTLKPVAYDIKRALTSFVFLNLLTFIFLGLFL